MRTSYILGWWMVAIFAGCTSAPIDCDSARDCSGSGLVCDLDRGVCVECVVDDDCLGASEVCRGGRCEVVVPCTSSRMCPNQVCDPVRMYCVDCVENADCEAPLECDAEGFCAPPPPASCREADACIPGTRTRTNDGCEPGLDRAVRCDDACAFVDEGVCEPIEGCPGVPVCTPGTRGRSSAGCDAGDSRETRCNTTCQFDPVGECESEACSVDGACTPGEGGWISDGCSGGEVREVRCTDECAYETVTACIDNRCESPGVSEQVACGTRCGERTRRCNAERQWDYELCAGEGECVAGSSERVACGACGTQLAHCNETCEWTASEECGGEVGCVPGTTVRTSAGCDPDETRFATCSATCGPEAGGVCESVVPPGAASLIVPYLGTPSAASQVLAFRTAIQIADIYFLFDNTASMQLTIDSVEAAITSVIGGLTCTDRGTVCASDDDCASTDVCSLASSRCIESPAVDGCVPDPYTGAGNYETFVDNQLSLQPSPAATSTELATWTADGSGTTEQLYDSLLSLADPSTALPETGCTGPSIGRIGCPAFRADARRFVFVFTDEQDNGGTTSAGTAGAALLDAGITLIGVNTGSSSSSRASLEAVAITAQSFRGDGVTPLVYDATASTTLTAVESALDEVLLASPQEITARIEDQPGDDGDALDFVTRIRTNTTASGCAASATDDTDGDGSPDTFLAVAPGTRVCFDVVATPNTTTPSGPFPAVFQARVTILGNGSPLDHRDLYFVVPATP